MPYRQRQPVDYANIYFGFIVWRAIGHVLGYVVGGFFLIIALILDSIWPNQAPQILADIFITAIVAGAFSVFWIICSVVYRVFVPVPRRTNAEIAKSLGWTPNPPEGVSWFRENGEKKQFDPATQTWS